MYTTDHKNRNEASAWLPKAQQQLLIVTLVVELLFLPLLLLCKWLGLFG